MAVLVLHSDPTVASVLASNIKVYTNQLTKVFSDVLDAIEYLNSGVDEVSSVVTSSFGNNPELSKIYEFKKANKESFSIFAFGESRIDEFPQVSFLNKGSEVPDLLKGVAKIKGIKAVDVAKIPVEEYFPFHKSLFIQGNRLKTEIFVKLDNEYCSLIKPGGAINLKVIEKDQTQFLYVRSEERLKFLAEVTSMISNRLQGSDKSEEESLEANSQGYTLVQMIRILGVTEESQKATDAIVKSMLKSVGKNKVLKSLLSNILNNKSGFRYKKDMMTLYIGSHIVDQAEWGSKEMREKLCYLSLLADISLQTEAQARVSNVTELKRMGCAPAERNQILNHALESSKIAAQFDQLPMGVETLIKQHHGATSGIGFKVDPSSLSPLVLIYMMSEVYAREIIHCNETTESINDHYLQKVLEHKCSASGKFKQYLKYFSELNLNL